MFEADDAEQEASRRARTRVRGRAPSLLAMGRQTGSAAASEQLAREIEPQPQPQEAPAQPAAAAPSAAPVVETAPAAPPIREPLGSRLRRRLRGDPAVEPDLPARAQVEEPDREAASDVAAALPPPRPARHSAAAPSNDRPSADDEWRPLVDPGTVVAGVLRSKTIILLCTVAGAMLGVAIALSTPKIYSATTDLLVDPRDLKIVDRDLNQSGFSSDAALAMVENQVRIMTSGSVLNGVTDRLELEQDPEFNGLGDAASGIPNPLSTLRALLSGGGAGAADPGARRAITVSNLAKHIHVGRSGSTFVVSITADAQDAEKAATIANTVSEVYLETTGEMQASTVGRATDELTARLDELRRSVEEAERAVESFKRDNGIIDAQGRLITDDEIVRLNDQLSVARARTAELRARAASAGSVDTDAVIQGILPEQVNSGVMSELRSQFAALRQEADRLAVRLGPRHPQRQAVEAQLDGLRSQIATELSRITSSVQIELDRATDLERDLGDQLEQLKTRQGALSGELVTLRELEREASSSRAVYEAYLLRARETSEQQNINTTNVNVISRATAPLLPAGPSRASIALTGMILGLAAGLGIGVLRGTIDSIRDNGSFRAAQRRRRRHSENEVATTPPEPDLADAHPVRVTRPQAPHAPSSAPNPGKDRAARQSPPGEPMATAPRHDMPHSRHSARLVPAQASHGISSARSWHAHERAPATAQEDGAEPAPTPVDELRESLREFRDAVRDLADSRTRRGA